METEHPQTGEQVREWDCIFVWQVMWQGDTSRQVVGAHAAVVHQTQEATKRQDALLTIVAGGPRPSDAGTRSALPSDHPESLPSPQERP